MHILFLSRWFPYPVDNGSKIRIYNLLCGLAQCHRVSLISFYDPTRGKPDVSSMLSVCQDVQVVPRKAYHPDSRRARLGFLSTTPRAYVDTFSTAMEQCIADTLASAKIDLVIASQIDTALYVGAFRGTTSIFEEVEIGVIHDQFFNSGSLPARLRGGLTWVKYNRFLAKLLVDYRACTVVSDRERMILQQRVRHDIPVEVIPNCVDLTQYLNVTEKPQPDSLIFTGSLTFRPNYEAICWFLEMVFPQLRAQIPGVRLVITGEHANLPLPEREGVFLTGIVEDVRPYLARGWLSIVPLQSGGGTRFKILESMALRTPVVSTTKGAEGLDAQPGVHLLVADDPQEFASAVLSILLAPALRQQLVEKAFDLVQERYNWRTSMPKYLELVAQVTGISG